MAYTSEITLIFMTAALIAGFFLGWIIRGVAEDWDKEEK